MSNYWKKKLDELNAEKENATKKSSNSSDYWKTKMDDLEEEQRLRESDYSDDVAPVKESTGNDSGERKWFQKGAFEDGYQFGDVFKAAESTLKDAEESVMAGILGIGEAVVDTGAYLVGGVGGLFGADAFKDKVGDFIEKDLYDEKKVAQKIVTARSISSLWTDTENDSLLGEKSEGLAQSGGQLIGTAALQAVGVPWWATTGVTSFGSGTEEALNEGASYGTAGAAGAIQAGADILTEKLVGGSGLGEKGLINVDGLTKGISNKVVKALMDYGIDVVSEGGEEVAASVISKFGDALYKEESLGELLTSEEAFDEYLESFIGGAVLGGGMNSVKVADSIKSGKDYRTGLTDNEQKVVDKVYEDAIAEKEADGTKLTQSEKNKIYDSVLEEMEKGDISTDTIEEVLGGETYKSYKDTIDNEEAAIKELSELYEGEELQQAIDDIIANSERGNMQTKLSDEVYGLVKDSRLAESYNQKSQRSVAYQADLTKYDTAQQSIIQKAIDSGILNNTRKTHDFVDMLAKISADKGVSFDFTNNEKLKGSSFAVDGKAVNGYVTNDGITLNMNSAKALNSVVGHEVTHVLEGTEMYDALQDVIFEYANNKKAGDSKFESEYKERLYNTRQLYKDVEGYQGVEGFKKIKREVVADLVGDYIFNDTKFIQNLSTKHRNLFEKLYDEIKYMCKIATAGSKELRDLERAKKAFEDAYRADGKAMADGEVKHSISATEDGLKYVKLDGNIFIKEDGTEMSPREAYNALVGQKITLEDGDVITFVKNLPGIDLYKELFRKLPGYEEGIDVKAVSETINKNIVEVVSASEVLTRNEPQKHPHVGIKDFDQREVYMTDGGEVYRLELCIANLTDNTKIAYVKRYIEKAEQEIADKIKKAETAGQTRLNQPFDGSDQNEMDASKGIVPQNESDVNTQFSISSDSDGKTLTKEQSEYFKDSKMRDDDGNLMVMYHGSQDAGFHTFDANMSDDGSSFFFVDRNDVAASYSGTTETYEAQTIHTADDMNKFIESVGAEGYEVVEKDGKFTLLYDGERVADSNTAKGIYDEFCWYEGVGEGDANYKVYLNLKNPLVVDAEGRNWNNISREYSQEIADRYNSLTAEEKAALTNLAEWGEYSIFKDEMLEARAAAEQGVSSGFGDVAFTKTLARAYAKLGGANANLYDAFSIASDNFSAEAIQEFAVKQMNTRDYAKKAKSEGYDGVIFKNIHDNGGYSNGSEGASTVAIAFESNQIKSVANEKPTGDKDIRYSLTEYTAEEKKAHNDAVVKHFGKTYSWAETGYLLLDGTKLDLSGKHDGAPGGYRTVDHRDITEALGYDYGGDDYSGSLVQFMSEGNIRIIPECNGINLSVKPTEAQEQALSSYISKYRGEVLLDIDDLNGNTVVSVEYPYGTYYTKILNDIREWFDNGKKPENSGSYSLTKEGDTPNKRDPRLTYGEDVLLEQDIAPVQDAVQDIAPVADAVETMPDSVPMTEEEASAMQTENIETLTDADVPVEAEAPYYGEAESATPSDPFESRDIKTVGSPKTSAYVVEHPEALPYFQEAANAMLGDLRNTVRGERHPINDADGYIVGWDGTRRQTTDDIAYLLDNYNYTYEQIESALNSIIEGNGKYNAAAKRIEFLLNDRLMKGYTDVSGYDIPPNHDYINLLGQQQTADAVNRQGVDAVEHMQDDIAPVGDIAPVSDRAYEAIRPPRQSAEPRMTEAAPRMKRADSTNNAPDGMEERSWYETSTESDAVGGMVTPDDIPDDVRYYQVKSNKKTLETANARLARDGYAKSREYFEGRMSDRKLSVEDIALGERLIQEAAKAGDAEAVRDLIIDVSILGTELGQRVQALSMIRRLTPEGQLRALIRTVERAKAKGDKSYDGVEVTDDMAKTITDVYNEDGTFDQAELDSAVEDVKQQIADQMPVSAWDKVNAWRYLSMLGNPKTHIRNIVSNVAMYGTRAVKNAIARTIEDIAPVKSRTKTWGRASDAVKNFAKQTTKEMDAAIKEDTKYSEVGSIKAKRKMFNSKIINAADNFNSGALEWEDALFSKNAFRKTLQEYLTANGIKTEADIKSNPKLVENAKEYALEESRKATFRQDSYFANKISEIEQRNPIYGVAVGSVMPFKKTPINIAKTGLAYSPLGFARNVYDAVQVKKGNMDASEAIDHLSQTLTGTALTVIGFALAESGVLNGAGEDDKEGKYDYQLGEQSYSFNFGGDSYSLSWLSPVAMPLFVGANAYETLVEKNEWDMNVVIDTLAQTLDPLSEMSFLSSLDSVLSSYDSGIEKFMGAGEAMIQNYATQFVPTLSSQLATTLDDTKRSTKASGTSGWEFGEETLNKIKYKIPGIRNTLEPTTDIWGNEYKQTENIFVRAFESFLSPANKRAGISTAVDEELKSLYGETGDSSLIPSIPSDYLNYDGEKYDMSAKEYTEYKQTYGQTALDLMEQLFDTNTYKSATSEERADMVSRVYDYARDKAKKEYFTGQGVRYTNAQEDGVDVFKEDAIKGAIEADLPVDEYTFSQEYPEKYKFFKDVGISYRTYKEADEDGKRAYTWAYENPGKYEVSKAISDDFMEYYGYKSAIGDFDAKNASGETVSGLKKERVTNYINGLDLDYGQKIILFKSQYKTDDTYNYEIIDYLNGRDDISYEEMETILEELGFTVDSKGNIYWD